jgi:hypothetical protein
VPPGPPAINVAGGRRVLRSWQAGRGAHPAQRNAPCGAASAALSAGPTGAASYPDVRGVASAASSAPSTTLAAIGDDHQAADFGECSFDGDMTSSLARVAIAAWQASLTGRAAVWSIVAGSPRGATRVDHAIRVKLSSAGLNFEIDFGLNDRIGAHLEQVIVWGDGE